MPGRFSARSLRRLALLLLFPALSGCATLQGLFALQQVDFSLDRVAQVRIAGVEVERIHRYEDLGAADAARVLQAVAARQMPLSLTLHVSADNPADNPQAQLMEMDWTLLLEDRETVSGDLGEAVRIPSGERVDIPLQVQLDLLEFFDGGARELVNLALGLAGREGHATDLTLRATPTVDTPLGPIRYPRPLTLVRQEVGG